MSWQYIEKLIWVTHNTESADQSSHFGTENQSDTDDIGERQSKWVSSCFPTAAAFSLPNFSQAIELMF